MVGNPKFDIDDLVKFEFGKNEFKVGKVYIIDRYGNFFDDSDVSYDIMVESENCLYKHINEKFCQPYTI